MGFSSRRLHHNCFTMPCSKRAFYNSLLYMESVHQACLKFSCHVSTVLCHAPNIWISHWAPGVRGDGMLKVLWYEQRRRCAQRGAEGRSGSPACTPVSPPRPQNCPAAIGQLFFFFFLFSQKVVTAGKKGDLLDSFYRL